MLDETEYLKYFPFLSNSGQVVNDVCVTMEKIEFMNNFDVILFDIYNELSTLITSDIKKITLESFAYEVSKFYMTILLLKGLNNIAITRIWKKFYMKKINNNVKLLLKKYPEFNDRLNLFLNIYRLLESSGYYGLKRITIQGEVAFGLHMNVYLDLADTLIDDTTILHKGYVIIPIESTDFLTKLIQSFVTKKIDMLYEKANYDVNITNKLKSIIEKLRENILQNQQVSINVKKHFVKKELLLEQQKILEVEEAQKIVTKLDNKDLVNIKNIPPCITFIFDKLINKKIALNHQENLLLVSYLGTKHFDKDQIIKIFAKAINYNKGITEYQVSAALDKGKDREGNQKVLLPMNCSNLQMEGVCKIDLDKTTQCGRIKSPLSYK